MQMINEPSEILVVMGIHQGLLSSEARIFYNHWA
jgi:hypothetical protein